MQRESELKLEGWKFIYTDGSKSDQNTAYAVVSENSKIITKGLLLPPCSVFTAEAYAIKVATQWIMSSKGKYVICTDSLSTISAVQNPTNSNTIIKEIRDNLIEGKRKIKLMWVPGHCDIKGNELPDKEAKNTIRCPCIYVKTYENKDISKFIKKYTYIQLKVAWSTYINHYRLTNPERTKAVYPSSCSIPEIKIFIRLRLGHCIFTHQHILERNTTTPGCRLCNSSTNSIEHLLNHCPALCNIRREFSYPISKLLKEPSTTNIKTIYNFISKAQLKHLI
ncbi:uncharacterized protein LOC128922191 [Zeugodacus cucurbitae]|uniref:uncharacterized protein LOC128922191 n=1 Tax=Zeugodacus cucurbitae TaxID=28588 RepID=UPI0023D92CD8|nr:uncharacterized protein LOC128922191 [Zeugodacus cucurbitae]